MGHDLFDPINEGLGRKQLRESVSGALFSMKLDLAINLIHHYPATEPGRGFIAKVVLHVDVECWVVWIVHADGDLTRRAKMSSSSNEFLIQ